MIRKITVSLIALLTVLAVSAGRYESTAAKANRSFEGREWASAAALYELMIDMRPDSAGVYSRCIVASDLAGDTLASVDLVERAMGHGIGLSELLDMVRTDGYSVGEGDRYGRYLMRLRNAFPWMERALDHELLNHYAMRHDGEMMVTYAGIMLKGLPDSLEYLSSLAEGYMLCGDWDNAVSIWKRMIEIDENNITALLYLGNYYNDRGDRESALPLLIRANNIQPSPYLDSIISSIADVDR